MLNFLNLYYHERTGKNIVLQSSDLKFDEDYVLDFESINTICEETSIRIECDIYLLEKIVKQDNLELYLYLKERFEEFEDIDAESIYNLLMKEKVRRFHEGDSELEIFEMLVSLKDENFYGDEFYDCEDESRVRENFEKDHKNFTKYLL